MEQDGGAKIVNVTDHKIDENFIDSSGVFITLTAPILNRYSNQFINMILSYIGAKTDINYRIQRTKSNTVSLPILAYQKEELHTNPVQLIKKRIATLKEYLERFDWKATNAEERYLARSYCNDDIELKLKVVSDNQEITELFKDETIKIPACNVSKPKVKKITLSNGSFVVILADPLLIDYGLYVDLSVPFSEYAFGHNYLHLYEHLMTICWEEMNSNGVIEFNGSTYPTGISFVYTIHSDINSLKKFANDTLKFIKKTRDREFWEKDMKPYIERETSRTISETLNLRSYSIFGRSDVKAYSNNYNIDVFHYWSNRPFRLLITCKSFDEIDFKGITDSFNDVPMPKTIKLKKAPIEVFKMKSLMQLKNKKVSEKEIIDIVYNNKMVCNACYGIDCIVETSADGVTDIGESNGSLHPLLFLARFVDESKINEYLDKFIIPNSNLNFASTSF